MALNLLRALPSFEKPLELLGACHDNVRRFTGQLTHLAAAQAHTHGDEATPSIATQILRYFDQAAPHHHADEEEDLFPALQALGDDKLNQKIEQLYLEHQQMAAAWQHIRQQLLALQAGLPADLSEARSFCLLYENHARFEDEQIYPHATRLAPELLSKLGLSMAARRTVPTASTTNSK